MFQFKSFQKSVYTFFEALAVCHTVQVAGSYEEEEDRADEEQGILGYKANIPPIFHKSLEELNDIESVHEEIDFIATKQTVTFDRNGNLKQDEKRPFSAMVPPKNPHDSHHKRPLSLSNIQLLKTTTSGPDSPTKHVEFANENPLLRRVQQQEYKRAVSHNMPEIDGTSKHKESMTHRRTQSSIPFGSSGNLLRNIRHCK